VDRRWASFLVLSVSQIDFSIDVWLDAQTTYLVGRDHEQGDGSLFYLFHFFHLKLHASSQIQILFSRASFFHGMLDFWIFRELRQ
jgi:hypothetical protein